MINASSGTSLPAPYDDWTWVSTSEKSHRFTGLTLGEYVFAVRAVDQAGARETGLVDRTNIRRFSAWYLPPGPGLRITSNVLVDYIITTGDPILGPEYPRPIQILSSQVVSFAWTATTSSTGAPLRGFTFALDDTTTEDWSDIDAGKVATTLPADLAEGPHSLFIRAVDVDGGATVVRVPIIIVLPEFREGPPLVLWVDDFAAPGNLPRPNYPSDDVDNERSDGIEGRGYPRLQDLARYRVVIWSVDLNNTTSSPTALWRTTVGETASDLANYVRGGGTLIVTGFVLANNTSNPPGTPYSVFSRGMCAGLQPGSAAYRFAYFLRTFMGIDAARSSDEATRTNGARDFVEARVTGDGTTMGFQTVEVDSGTGAKWDPYVFPGAPDLSLSPGLPKVEGWRMQADFGCGQQGMRVENPATPVAVPLFTYHGVNQGVLQDGSPSKRENLVIGVATQAHDLGESDGRPITPGDTRGVMGRMAFLGFPIYYMKDDQAYAVMRAAFAYVNESPTLGRGF